MKRGCSSRILISAVALICLFAATLGFFIKHGDVTYRMWDLLRVYDKWEPEAVELETVIELSGEALFADERITVSHTVMLVNSDNPLPSDYTPVLQEYNKAKMHPDMVSPYIAMRDEIQRVTGSRIFVSSDYRTPQEQAELLIQNGAEIAAEVGCSEHEAGLALDLYVPYFAGESFLKSRAGRMVNEICSEYGYIIRYPQSREDITGISYEPWHVRYVGAPHAKAITSHGLTLEEYIASFSPHTWYDIGDYLVSRQSGEHFKMPRDYQSCHISSDNTGYYLITVKK